MLNGDASAQFLAAIFDILKVVSVLLAVGGVLYWYFFGKHLTVHYACHFLYGLGRLFVEFTMTNRDPNGDEIQNVTAELQLGQERYRGTLRSVYDLTNTHLRLQDFMARGVGWFNVHQHRVPLPIKMQRESRRLLATFDLRSHAIGQEVDEEGRTITWVSGYVPQETVSCVIGVTVMSRFKGKTVHKRCDSIYLSGFPGGVGTL
jgi:small nuclear ribonucleoprotein (snRNP)-like protein